MLTASRCLGGPWRHALRLASRIRPALTIEYTLRRPLWIRGCIQPVVGSLTWHRFNHTEAPSSAEEVRRIMRKVPQPVVVVTTCDPENSQHRRGITVSSFTSISLYPKPYISFCIKVPSRASDLLHRSNIFVVHILSHEQVAHSIAFSSPNQKGTDQFKDVHFYSDPQTHLPVLMGTVGAMHCRQHRVITIGEHELWIGEVYKVDHGIGSTKGTHDEGSPLLLHDRKYRNVGDEVFMTAFENQSLEYKDWTHRAHLRMAWNYIRDYGKERAAPLIKSGIKKYNKANTDKVTGGYNETITCFFIEKLDEAIRKDRQGGVEEDEFLAFLSRHPQLADRKFIFQYYTKDQINTLEAQTRLDRHQVSIPQNLSPKAEQIAYGELPEFSVSEYYSRLTPERKQRLLTTLSAIKVRYVANRSPPKDSAKLLYTYKCQSSDSACGSFSERLSGVVSAFYVSLLSPDSGFSIDWTHPYRLDDFLRPPQWGMAIDGPSLDVRKSLTDPSDVLTWPPPNTSVNATLATDIDQFRNGKYPCLVQLSLKTASWEDLRADPHKTARGKEFQLDQLDRSEMFFIAYRLLFSAPSDRLSKQLNKFGQYFPSGMGLKDMRPPNPDDAPPSSEVFNIGVRIDGTSPIYQAQQDTIVRSLATKVVQICMDARTMQAYVRCNVFITTNTPSSESSLRAHIKSLSTSDPYRSSAQSSDSKPIIIYSTRSEYPKDFSLAKPTFYSKLSASRQIDALSKEMLDWVLLSRMDCIVALEADESDIPFWETAAWVAQARTILLNDGFHEYHW